MLIKKLLSKTYYKLQKYVSNTDTTMAHNINTATDTQ